MARLSKEQLGDRGRFRFRDEEVQVPGLGGSVVVRSPSVAQRDRLNKETPDEQAEWTIEHVALLFSTVVVNPQVTKDEAMEFLGDWPGEALDAITDAFANLIGTKEEQRDAVGDFPGEDDGPKVPIELARSLGMTVGELEDRMTAKEYWYWGELGSRENAEAEARQSARK